MTDVRQRVGVIGATSIIGDFLLTLLVENGYDVVAFTRQALPMTEQHATQGVTWRLLPTKKLSDAVTIKIKKWICLAPIWFLPEHFSLLKSCDASHVVAVSSTSRFTKGESSDPAERKLVENIAENEKRLTAWAEKEKLTFTILRPTLVYGRGRDKNISVIARFIKRFSFFPLLGKARGFRQPVHAQDVAFACLAALTSSKAANRSYNISGGEIVSYREMVGRIFLSVGRKPRFLEFPLWLFRLAIFFLRVLPPFRKWSPAMAERMNQNLVFDYQEAARDLNFAPRQFVLRREDIFADEDSKA